MTLIIKMNIYKDAQKIISEAISENMPEKAVKKALERRKFNSPYLIAIGKAAWNMAKAAHETLSERGEKIKKGAVITKYKHSKGALPNIEIYEAGHPILDENGVIATERCIKLAESLEENDELLFLISGGGSALFEKPANGLSLLDIQEITNELLFCGANIIEINMIRKRLSAVKAGRFAKIVAPAKIFSIILSDVLGDRLDSIASGPVSPDNSTVQEAAQIIKKYNLKLNETQSKRLSEETPKEAPNSEAVIIGSVRSLCDSASKTAKKLGYTPSIITTSLDCEAREAGRFLAAIARDLNNDVPRAIILGGETVVNIKEKSENAKGGRNQELILAALGGIDGLKNTLIFSLGSDGTDGPTDAAGAICCGETANKARSLGIDINAALAQHNSYNALKDMDALLFTGPTGSNINDLSVILKF